ncbi:MAG: MFS transporter [Chloroflexi bacterium]|nr:MFS transporter [Chloroflexota bacterium]MDL1883738.1 TCR/Tet family MFS transporter [Anaerolineae bacterium CFX8]
MTAPQMTAAADKLDFKRILPIFIIVLVDLIGLTIIIPLLSFYAAAFGADPFTVGLLATAYPLMQLFGGPLLGSLSDRYGRKPVLVVSQLGTFVGFLLLGLANALPLVLLSRVIDGLTGGNIVVAQAAITDSTTEKTRTQGLGLIGAAFGLGFILGPVISGIALGLSGNNYHVPAFVAAAFSLTSVLLTSFWFKETLPADRRGENRQGGQNVVAAAWRALRNPLIGALLALMFLQQLVFYGFESLLTLFTLTRLGMNAFSNALVFVFVGLILVLVQGKYIGPWSRKYGERRLIYAGLGLLAIGLILTAATPGQPVPWYSRSEMLSELSQAEASSGQLNVTLPDDSTTGWLGFVWLMIAMIPTSIGGGILSPSINSLITKRISAAHIGGTLGVSSSLVSAANAITPLIGGTVFQFLGAGAPFLIGGVMMGVLLLAAIRHVQPGPEEGVISPVG